MSAATAQRTGKAAKDRGSKPQSNQAQNSKSVDKKMQDGVNSKLQPNAEQFRIAQIIDQSDDPDLNEKVEQVKEITGKTYDDVIVALHDCDLDTNRATNLLLEGGDQTTGEWQVPGKKKRNRQVTAQKANGVSSNNNTSNSSNSNNNNNANNNKENRNRAERSRDRDQKEREVTRNRGPPRLNRLGQRGTWRKRENEKNEKNADDFRKERSMDDRRGGRRGRGRGGSRSRTFQNRGLSSGGFPQSIDTWTNSTAEQTDVAAANDNAMTVGNWSDFTATEDWSEEDWTGSLTETKVFTPSANAHSLVNNIDESPTHISQSLDLAALLQKTTSSEPSLTQNSMSSSVMTQPQQHSSNVSPPTVSSSVTQAPGSDSQAQFSLSQYAQQAAESIKAAVGIGTSLNTSSSLQQQGSSPATSPFTSAYTSSSVSGGTSHPTASPSPVHVPMDSQQVTASQAPGQSATSVSQQKPRQSSQQPQALPQRGRNQRPKVPKPSKIPQSAVEMPDDAVTALDVQFGALEFGTDSSPFDISSTVETPAAFQEVDTSANTSVTNHIIPQSGGSGSQNTATSSAPTTMPTTLVPSSTINKESSFSFGSHTSASSTNQSASKELEQASGLNHSQKVSGPESSLLSASQTDRSSVGSVSGYGSQRASQSSTYDAYTSQTSSNFQPSVNSFSSQQNYSSTSTTSTTPSGSSLHSATVAQSKLTSSLSHTMKDSVLDSQRNSAQHSYESSHVAVTSTTSGLTATASSSVSTSSLSSASISVSSTLGLASSSTASSTTVSKSSVSTTGKAMPSIPPGVPPVLGHQYIMSQTGMPFYGLQQPVYNYEELQLLQSRLPTLGYYDVQFQAPTSLTGRDPSLGSVAYTGTDGKFSRAEDATSVATTLSQGQGTTQTHGQPFLNPAALPPGYGYYFPGGMMPGSIHHYGPPIFPIPPATNTNGASTSTQFQKPVAYLSHSYPSASAYDTLSQTQDFKGGYGPTAQVQGKGVSGSSTASGANADLTGPMYSKTHAQMAKWSYMDGNPTGLVNINSVGNQRKDDSKLLSSIIPPALYHCTNAYTNSSFEKPGFHTGTPPPFNLAGTQTAGAIGASSGPYAAAAAAATSFIPLLHGQHHSTMLHHHLQQDSPQPGSGSAGGPQRSGPQGLSQPKGPSGNKQSMAYWNNN